MGVCVQACAVWLRLPSEWTKRCRDPEAMRLRFGACTPQPLVITHEGETMYLFCVAMSLDRAVEITEAAGARLCCQGVEGMCFDVTLYTAQHGVRATGGVTASGDDQYELVPRVERQRRRWPHRWRCPF